MTPTGIWEMTISGGPIPEPESATLSITPTGSEEGRLVSLHRLFRWIVGTLEGTTLKGTIEVPDGDLPDTPRIEAELTGEDSMEGRFRSHFPRIFRDPDQQGGENLQGHPSEEAGR